MMVMKEWSPTHLFLSGVFRCVNFTRASKEVSHPERHLLGDISTGHCGEPYDDFLVRGGSEGVCVLLPKFLFKFLIQESNVEEYVGLYGSNLCHTVWKVLNFDFGPQGGQSMKWRIGDFFSSKHEL